MNKGVSIIIPCYYRWEYVDECLDSVFQQRNVDTQIICTYTPRNSDQRLLNELKKIEKQRRITLVANETYDYGAAYSRNRGLDCITKDTVMFIDDDDKIGWNPDKADTDPYYLEYFYDVLAADSNLAMVIGDVINANDGLEKTNFKKYVNLPKKKPVTYSTGLGFLDARNTSCATLYRSQVINKVHLRFKPQMQYHEDTQFIMQYALSAAFDYKYTLKPVKWPDSNEGLQSYYWYRQHRDSVMGRTCRKSLNLWRNKYQKQKDTLAHYGYLLDTIENHPLFGKNSAIYEQMVNSWCKTQKEIAQDIADMNPQTPNEQFIVGPDILALYTVLTCFNEEDRKNIPEAAKDYLLWYCPDKKNQKIANASAQMLAFTLFSSGNTDTSNAMKAEFRRALRSASRS